jgi:hypothetical protein
MATLWVAAVWAVHQARPILLNRRSIIASGSCVALGGPAFAGADASAHDSLGSLTPAGGDGFILSVPSSYYRAKGGRTSVADIVFVAADYPAGRTAAVTRARADRLLIDSGDPVALTSGSLSKMKELGRPAFLASLLVRRRDGDPRGQAIQPRSQLISAAAVSDNELRFEVRETIFSATGSTSAIPASRSVQGRALFVPADAQTGTAAYLLTAWASSASSAEQIRCEPTPCDCGEGAALSCDCPAPRCTESSENGTPARDALDVAIVESLCVAPISFSLQQSLKLKIEA